METNPYKYGIFYYDPADKRVFVPRALGWNLNFDRRQSYIYMGIFVVAFIGVLVYALLNIKQQTR